MKRQIRKNVFETNSSSTHAICISKGEYNIINHIDFEVGDFGWEFETYRTLHSKASYLITAILDLPNKETSDNYLNKLTDILDNNGIEYTLPELKVGSYKFGENTVYYYVIDGYVDHASETKEFLDTVLSDSYILFRYLFGDSMIITGNDNSDVFSDRMYVTEGEEVSKCGTYTIYGNLKPEFDNYEIYMKGN